MRATNVFFGSEVVLMTDSFALLLRANRRHWHILRYHEFFPAFASKSGQGKDLSPIPTEEATSQTTQQASEQLLDVRFDW